MLFRYLVEYLVCNILSYCIIDNHKKHYIFPNFENQFPQEFYLSNVNNMIFSHNKLEKNKASSHEELNYSRTITLISLLKLLKIIVKKYNEIITLLIFLLYEN